VPYSAAIDERDTSRDYSPLSHAIPPSASPYLSRDDIHETVGTFSHRGGSSSQSQAPITLDSNTLDRLNGLADRTPLSAVCVPPSLLLPLISASSLSLRRRLCGPTGWWSSASILTLTETAPALCRTYSASSRSSERLTTTPLALAIGSSFGQPLPPLPVTLTPPRFVSSHDADRVLSALDHSFLTAHLMVGVRRLNQQMAREMNLSVRSDGRLSQGGVVNRESLAGAAYRRELDPDFESIMRPPQRSKDICSRLFEFFMAY
jgi:hypothetical protein